MKKIAYIIAGMALLAVSCNKEVKPLDVKPTSGVKESTLTGYMAKYEPFLLGTGTVNTIGDDQYYKDLRQWKEDAWDERGLVTRSISYIFFADYGSMAFRFADVPDSIDVINLWGGCPKKGSLDYMEMKACQEVKGDKIVGCRITRILENQKWGLEAGIPSYMRAYYKYKADHQPELDKIQNSIEEFDPSEYESEAAAADALAALKASLSAKETDIENAAKLAGNNALRTDVNQHQTKADSTWPDEDENWPEWIVYGAGHLVNEVAEYGLNGYDLDYEPEGDPLSGTAFNTFVSYMAQYMGPMADEDYKLSFVHHVYSAEIVPDGEGYTYEENIEEEYNEIEYGDLLIIDRNSGVGDSSLAKYCNFWIYQMYGSTGGAGASNQGCFPSNLNPDNGWVPCQVITTENVGDTYSQGCNNLEQHAKFQPNTLGKQYGHKGGFASFHGQRDWRLEAEGAEAGKKLRYQHHRVGINYQAQQEYYK